MPRVLLIEDNEANQDLISRYLGLLGCDVIVASDGPSGLETARCEGSQFDLVLMDVNLPGMDGWEVTRRLKSDPQTRRLPVIALTAHAMAGDREQAQEAGCDAYVTKPIDFLDLFGKIQSLACRVHVQ
jgi:two-component system, cell cycle response regulator DivK